ncbi:DUF2309 domain-containing protein [Flavobacterium beibuense]|uniref:Probable inorganic carbon transporter subunit DabA n=1 Tax=Flavobacterium beibuense TaxID=657326 RepID=A0A444WAD4_9FLAO|nr:DUF2309 domain-containing protein [Flavobacterium beibuense]RYJ42840.1 hypothetical protein NU09_1939 [Flavobacterium beibuense]
MKNKTISQSIGNAAKSIRTTWPLYSFVTSNPLAGHEDLHFFDAVMKSKMLSGGDLLPNPAILRRAFEQGEIDQDKISGLLAEHGIDWPAGEILESFSDHDKYHVNENATLDRVVCKYLMAFMDEGLAEWEMPFKKEGFYNAWRKLAVYDKETGCHKNGTIPHSPEEAITIALAAYPEEEHEAIIEYQLNALPGWAGYIKFRTENDSPWQQHYPITLGEYLAVRLWTAVHTGAKIKPAENEIAAIKSSYTIQYLWLQAWEKSWQDRLISKLSLQEPAEAEKQALPDAQMVFCIDTRSELIRRHIEATGNYETFGYAGFFGIAMDYTEPTTGIVSKSCPPILNSAYNVTEVPAHESVADFHTFQNNAERNLFKKYFLKRMKNLLPSAFGFVETSGLAYGLLLLVRSLFKGVSLRSKRKQDAVEHCCTPALLPAKPAGTGEISLEEQSIMVKTAFDLMGWTTFSPLVLFIGHGSHSSNNPFASSLDCGACAASPGRHNARMLAQLANLPTVRKILQQDHNVTIPDSTVFIAGEHNTVTDEITLFDTPLTIGQSTHLAKLKADLKRARLQATAERLGHGKHSSNMALLNARDWSQTRPEWGLAKNAGFIIGPRALTRNINLESQCFLHSYHWKSDPDATALEAIMQGPMVVTQWINNHYYFATVDNEKFGGGTKITHNVTGKFGVVQGNGGDLKGGLPLQSVNSSDSEIYHAPLRLCVVIQAPAASIRKVLERNEKLNTLIRNEWISLLVMDPQSGNGITTYSDEQTSEAPEHHVSIHSY